MIISTIGNMNFYDGSSFTNVFTHRRFQYQLPMYRGDYHLYFDTLHHAWLKNAGTLTLIDFMAENFETRVDSVLTAIGCPMPVLDLFADSDNQLWTLCEEGLYSQQHRKTFTILRDRNLQGVEVMGDMLLTFYDDGEEVAQDIATGNIIHRTKAYGWDTSLRYNQQSLLLRHGNFIYQVRQGEREAVLLAFNVKSQKWSTLVESDYHLNDIDLHNGKLYMASDQGYVTYDLSTGETERVEELVLNSGARIKVICNSMAFDLQGGMWLGTEHRGVLYARPKAMAFKVYSNSDPRAAEYLEKMSGMEQNITEFQGMRANCMYTDSRDWSWIGTTTGLYMYRDPHQEPIIFNKSNGLYNNVIHAVVEDNNHNVWASTSDGISCIMFKGHDVEFVNSFNTIDNVPSESFYNCKAVLMPNGEIAMQGLDHVIVFNPDDLKELNTPHPYRLLMKLSKIMVNGNVVLPGVNENGDQIIDRAIPRVKDIYLKSDQNTLSLTFSPLNYYRPLQSYFRARVIGLGNEEWVSYSYFSTDQVDSQGKLHLPLVGLEPGDYSVEVQASMFPDQWEGSSFKWEIHVMQSWWRSKGMFYIYGLLLLTLVIVNFVIYVHNTRMRVRRSHEEGDIISKICMFVERCDNFTKEKLSPSFEVFGSDHDKNQLSPEFIELMQKIMPLVRDSRREELSISKLSDVADIGIVKLYEMLSNNIHKSPRDMARQLRLEHAAEMLATTDKTIEEVSDECGFYTPNYFIGNFFHKYKQTPKEYREERRGL